MCNFYFIHLYNGNTWMNSIFFIISSVLQYTYVNLSRVWGLSAKNLHLRCLWIRNVEVSVRPDIKLLFRIILFQKERLCCSAMSMNSVLPKKCESLGMGIWFGSRTCWVHVIECWVRKYHYLPSFAVSSREDSFISTCLNLQWPSYWWWHLMPCWWMRQ